MKTKLYLLIILSTYSFSSLAQGIGDKDEIIFVYKSPCPGNAELSVNYLNKVMQYERDNSPYQHEVSCGIFDDGDVGCIDKTKSEKLREKITIWQENNPEWGKIIRSAWRACGIEDYEYIPARLSNTFDEFCTCDFVGAEQCIEGELQIGELGS